MQIERNRAMSQSPPMSGWDHILRAWAFHERMSSNLSRNAADEARRAVDAMPDLGLAHAWLAESLSVSNHLAVIRDDTRIREIHGHIKQAMELDGDNPEVLGLLAMAYGNLDDGETSLRLALRATDLNPHSAEAQNALGNAYLTMGRPAEIVAAFEKYVRLAPPDSVRHMALQTLAIGLCLEGRPAEAEAFLDRAMALDPQFGPTFRWKAIVAAQQGNEEIARDAVMRLRNAEPGLSLARHLENMMRVPRLEPYMTDAAEIFSRLWHETGGDP
jgi:tetratricopeptide (TPR) repeat protein